MPLVLVVDDDPDIRELVRTNLEAAGYRVNTARNGKEALRTVRDESPDAIFLDVMMPEVDGWTVLRQLKSESPEDLSLIPVFMITGLAEVEYRIRGGIEGAIRYFAKPIDPAELVDAVREVLNPASPTERELRLLIRKQSLDALARLEKGEDADSVFRQQTDPEVHLTQLESPHTEITPGPRRTQLRQRYEALSPKQQQLIHQLQTGKSVTDVAEALGRSRSNVYTMLKRIANKLGLSNASDLVAAVRQGVFSDDD